MQRQPITIYSQTQTPVGGGGYSLADVVLLETLAEVKTLKSTYANDNNQAVFQDAIKCKIWKRADYTPSYAHLVAWNGNKYAIRSIEVGVSHIKTDTFVAVRITNA